MKHKIIEYDKENMIPIIHASICIGEQIAGFKDKRTNKFIEIMLITSSRDLEDFKKTYGITEDIKKEY